jgi:outer membrane lipoprotein
MKNTYLIFAVLLLGACASTPDFDTHDNQSTLTPAQAVKAADTRKGEKVVWGGTIITSTNQKNETRLEILAYPLDSDHYPQLDKPAYGRFLLLKEGYLETVDYAPGRLVTVSGTLDGIRKSKLDESEYTYPLLQAEQLHLWSKSGKSQTRFHFGIGVMFSN